MRCTGFGVGGSDVAVMAGTGVGGDGCLELFRRVAVDGRLTEGPPSTETVACKVQFPSENIPPPDELDQT